MMKGHDKIDLARTKLVTAWLDPLLLTIKQQSDTCASAAAMYSIKMIRVASSSSWVSTCSAGSWTYRTTDPRMKQFFTAI